MTTSSRRGLWLIGGAAALWGCWSLALKNAERLSPTPLSGAAQAFVAFAVMLVVLLPRAALDTRRAAARPGRAWATLLLLGALDGVNFVCFAAAMQETTVAVAVLTHYLAPLFVALGAPLVGERWRGRTFLALGVALAGLLLLLAPWGASSTDLLGAGLGALSAVFYASNVLLSKRLGGAFSAYELTVWSKPVSLFVVGLAALATGASLSVAPAALGVLVVGSLVCGALTAVMFFSGLRTTTASQTAVLTLFEPLVAVLVGVLVWREPLGGGGVVGALLVLCGAMLIARRS
jgi:drug/metabolite transporter (DMT)-like permease